MHKKKHLIKNITDNLNSQTTEMKLKMTWEREKKTRNALKNEKKHFRKVVINARQRGGFCGAMWAWDPVVSATGHIVPPGDRADSSILFCFFAYSFPQRLASTVSRVYCFPPA